MCNTPVFRQIIGNYVEVSKTVGTLYKNAININYKNRHFQRVNF